MLANSPLPPARQRISFTGSANVNVSVHCWFDNIATTDTGFASTALSSDAAAASRRSASSTCAAATLWSRKCAR